MNRKKCKFIFSSKNKNLFERIYVLNRRYFKMCDSGVKSIIYNVEKCIDFDQVFRFHGQRVSSKSLSRFCNNFCHHVAFVLNK